MFELIGLIIILFLFGYIVYNGGVKTFWYYYDPGDINFKWWLWKKKKKK